MFRVNPKSTTFTNIILVYAIVGVLKEGIDIYKREVENVFSLNFIIMTTLVDMYAKCERI